MWYFLGLLLNVVLVIVCCIHHFLKIGFELLLLVEAYDGMIEYFGGR